MVALRCKVVGYCCLLPVLFRLAYIEDKCHEWDGGVEDGVDEIEENGLDPRTVLHSRFKGIGLATMSGLHYDTTHGKQTNSPALGTT